MSMPIESNEAYKPSESLESLAPEEGGRHPTSDAERAAPKPAGSEEYFQAKRPQAPTLPFYAWEEGGLPAPQEMGEDG